MMSIVLLGFSSERIPGGLLEQTHSLLPDYRVVVTHQREEIEPLLEEIVIAAGDFPTEWIPRARSLRWLQSWGAGADWLMRHPEIAALDFALTNASGVHAIPISEHILALMLALARHLPQAVRAQGQKQWLREGPVSELAGKTLLLVGTGAIGAQTARICSALGMRVIGIRRNPDLPEPGIEKVGSVDKLNEFLPEADFIALTIPLTHETHHLIGRDAFARMKPTACIINIGRGATIDEAALIQSLKEGKIAAAGLDVFETEPLPPESPLWEMENVLITAHYSGWTPNYDARAFEIFRDNLERFAAGRPLRNVVDKQLGY
jgi:phosphoglycerate dehydrogenase-like enzyme